MGNSQPNSGVVAPEETPSTRWWESYLVRYFIGFIVGAICIGILTSELSLYDRIVKPVVGSSNSETGWSALLITLGILGLGYCYVASTPITVLHYGRASQGWLDAHSRHFWFGWIIALVAINVWNISDSASHPLRVYAITLLCIILIILLPVKKEFDRELLARIEWVKNLRTWLCGYPQLLLLLQSAIWGALVWFSTAILVHHHIMGPESSAAINLWLLGAPVFWIGTVQYLVLARLITDSGEKDVDDFYKKLFHARRHLHAKGVRDTYTHLREHSNSVFIVVVELAILACLLALARATSGSGADTIDLSSYGQTVLIGLAIWMLPTVFMWSRANRLEKKFANNPDDFL